MRCKFKLDQIQHYHANKADGSTVPMRLLVLGPVEQHADPEHENSAFAEAVPVGQLTIGIATAEGLQLGAEYYLDITPVAP